MLNRHELSPERPWSQVWPTHLPPTLAYPEVPAWWILERNTERFSQRLALRMLDHDTGAELGTLTYEALWEAVRALAAGFRSLGIDRGDRIAFVLPNGPELIIGYYATWFVGATVVPLNPALTEPELAGQVADATVQLLSPPRTCAP